MTHAPRWAAAPSGLCQGWLAFMERQAVRDNAVVTSFDQRDQARLERHTLLTCKIGRVACAAQQALHLACPVLFLDLDQRLQFPQMVRIAQRMQQYAGHLVIGLPVVMHDNAGDLRQQAAALGGGAVEGEPDRRGDMQPLRLTANPEPGLIHSLPLRRRGCLTGAAATRSRNSSAKPW